VVTKGQRIEEFGGCSLRTVESNGLPFIQFHPKECPSAVGAVEAQASYLLNQADDRGGFPVRAF
jgi:hypothetical protein